MPAGGGSGWTLSLHGNQRFYLGLHPAGEWRNAQYDRLRLLGKSLRWTVDVSNVGCGCNAALYLVDMPQPDESGSRYCDIQYDDPERCLEIDLFEGNIKAAAATLHVEAGEASDGKCNQWGCAAAVGKDAEAEGDTYGIRARSIDASRPFDMAANFDAEGRMTIFLGQDGVWLRLWDVRSAGNWPETSVPEEASARVKASLEGGMVLVASLWGSSGDGMAWLDGGCTDDYPHCELDDATAIFKDVRIVGGMRRPL